MIMSASEKELQHQRPEKKKRRTPYSCLSCRRRKVKCDRARPKCIRCIKAKLDCEFDSPSIWGNSQPAGNQLINESTGLQTVDNSTESSTLQKASYMPVGMLEYHPQTKTVTSQMLQLDQSPIARPQNQTFSFTYNSNGHIPSPRNSLSSATACEPKKKRGRKSNAEKELIRNHQQQSQQAYDDCASILSSIRSANFFTTELDSKSYNATHLLTAKSPTSSLDDQPITPSSLSERDSAINEMADLKLKLVKLENKLKQMPAEKSETISLIENEGKSSLFFASKKARFMCLGTFSRSLMWKRDPIMSHLMEDFYKVKGKGEKEPLETNAASNTGVEGPSSKNLEKQVNLRKRGSKMGLLQVEGQQSDGTPLSENEALTAQMVNFIPSESIVNLHLKRFFQYIYPFMPVLDEKNFRDSIKRILVYPTGEHGLPTLKLEKNNKVDMILVATLLLIMRVSYSTLYLKNETLPVTPNSEDSLVLNHPIDANVISIVDLTLQTFNFLRKANLETIQLMIMLRRYHTLAQEDGDGCDGSDGYIYNGLLCHTALSMGLNREVRQPIQDRRNPSHINHQNPKFISIWKKIWWTVVDIDLSLCLNWGKLTSLHRDESDNQLPEFDSISSNLHNLELDKFVVDRIKKFGVVYPIVDNLLKMLHNLNKQPLIVDVQTELLALDNLKRELFDLNTKRTKYLSYETNNVDFIDSIKVNLQLNTFQYLIKYYLLLHFEKNQNFVQFHSALNEVIGLTLDNLEVALNAFKRSAGELSNYISILIHPIVHFLNKSLHFFLYLGVRILILQLKRKETVIANDDTLDVVVQDILVKTVAIMKICAKVFAMSGDLYYHSFRLCGYFGYLIDSLENGGYPIFNLKNTTVTNYPNLIENLSVVEFTHLRNKLDNFVNKDFLQKLNACKHIWQLNLPSTSLINQSNITGENSNESGSLDSSGLLHDDGGPQQNVSGDGMYRGKLFGNQLGFDILEDWVSGGGDSFDLFDGLGEFPPSVV